MNLEGLNEAELTKLLVGEGEMVTERLNHWAKVNGDKVFFYYGEDDLAVTYAEFARQSDAIAGNLARLGIEKGDHISVLSQNMLLSGLVMFGIWKAGAVYCPVNFSFKGRLLTYQMNDTVPKMIITDANMLPEFNKIADTIENKTSICVYHAPQGAHDYAENPAKPNPVFENIEWQELTKDCAAPGVEIGFDDPANLIYTSGTTGPAKGVLQPHRWMVHYTFTLRLFVTPDDVIYNDLPMYHVGGAIANVCRAAWEGCEVAAWNRFSPDQFWDRIAMRKVTTAILLDVMIPWLVKAPERDSDRENTLNKVHMQPLPLSHNDFARRFGVDFVTAGFGQTESGLGFWSILEETKQGEGTPDHLYRGYSHDEMYEISEKFDMVIVPGKEATRKGYMGRPSPFMEVAIRDENDEEVPAEVPGHLTFRSRVPGILLKGYLGKDDVTVSTFKNLWFHTGDAVVKGDDGIYYFVDRLGDRIRVRGENLSSFQVEDMINQHPQVQMCAALAIKAAEGDEDQIVVYVVPTEGELDEKSVIDFAAETMPKFMRPRYVRVVDDLPRTPTNKVEKYKLRKRILEELGRNA